jgi:small subunit ribosomal protein S17
MSFERRKIRVGRVVSDKMDKTVVVLVEWRRTHRLYRKSMRRRTRFNAHDENNDCRVGDMIRIIESRPLSKIKRWRVVEILSRQEIAAVQPEEIGVDESVISAGPARAEVARADEPVADEVETQAATAEVEKEDEPVAEEAGPQAPTAEVEKEDEPVAEEAGPQAATAEVEEAPEPVAEKAPKTRRRRVSKATAKTTEVKAEATVDKAEGTDPAAPDQAASESGDGEAAEEAEPQAATAEVAEADEPVAEEAPKTRRRKASKATAKTTEAKVKATVDKAEGTVPATPDKAASESGDGEAAEEAESQAASAEVAEADEPVAEKAPKKRRRSASKAPAKTTETTVEKDKGTDPAAPDQAASESGDEEVAGQ